MRRGVVFVDAVRRECAGGAGSSVGTALATSAKCSQYDQMRSAVEVVLVRDHIQ